MIERPSAPAALRNRDVILRLLSTELRHGSLVVEIGSGTGQHAIHFAAGLPQIEWQPTDRPDNIDGINNWIARAKLEYIREPLVFDVNDSTPDVNGCDAVFSANTAHIMSKVEVEQMTIHVGKMLGQRGLFFLYGPFRMNGRFSTDSNARFDASLREQNSQMGIRNLEWIDKLLSAARLCRFKTFCMPSNNLMVVWQKH